MHLQLMHHPSMCTGQWCPTSCPLNLPHKKVRELGHSYAQNKIGLYPQRIFLLLLAILNASFITLKCCRLIVITQQSKKKRTGSGEMKCVI